LHLDHLRSPERPGNLDHDPEHNHHVGAHHHDSARHNFDLPGDYHHPARAHDDPP
jgi:hypothetical protein